MKSLGDFYRIHGKDWIPFFIGLSGYSRRITELREHFGQRACELDHRLHECLMNASRQARYLAGYNLGVIGATGLGLTALL